MWKMVKFYYEWKLSSACRALLSGLWSHVTLEGIFIAHNPLSRPYSGPVSWGLVRILVEGLVHGPGIGGPDHSGVFRSFDNPTFLSSTV